MSLFQWALQAAGSKRLHHGTCCTDSCLGVGQLPTSHISFCRLPENHPQLPQHRCGPAIICLFGTQTSRWPLSTRLGSNDFRVRNAVWVQPDNDLPRHMRMYVQNALHDNHGMMSHASANLCRLMIRFLAILRLVGPSGARSVSATQAVHRDPWCQPATLECTSHSGPMPTGHNAEGIDALPGAYLLPKQTIMHCQDQNQACHHASYLCYLTSVCGMQTGGQVEDILCHVEPCVLFYP